MKNNYTWIAYNNNTRVVIFNGTQTVTNYSKLPKRLIETVADFLGLSLGGEMSMYTGKQIFKAGIKNSDNGGVVGLYTTESRAAFNRFVCNYVKKGV